MWHKLILYLTVTLKTCWGMNDWLQFFFKYMYICHHHWREGFRKHPSCILTERFWINVLHLAKNDPRFPKIVAKRTFLTFVPIFVCLLHLSVALLDEEKGPSLLSTSTQMICAGGGLCFQFYMRLHIYSTVMGYLFLWIGLNSLDHIILLVSHILTYIRCRVGRWSCTTPVQINGELSNCLFVDYVGSMPVCSFHM